jgi:hypothetical protein
MVTIENMEVRFDVEGEGDEHVFARLFAHHIERWARQQQDRARHERSSQQDRALGDRAGGHD